jgi:hypothetical protein
MIRSVKLAKMPNLLKLAWLAMVAHLVLCSHAMAADKITCLVDFTLNDFSALTGSSKKNSPKSKEDIEKAASSLLRQRLDLGNQFEVETREEAELAPGAKFKVARFMIASVLTILPMGKTSSLRIDSGVVKIANREIVAIAKVEEQVAGSVVWPVSIEEFNSNKFKNSASGKALMAAINKVAANLNKQADKICAAKLD